ncbi:MAG: hypothetical protein MZV64_18440 [Ignavibacteriales bacterium]|nr:hypothetical protein [Ignavibacteriales bacterium]
MSPADQLPVVGECRGWFAVIGILSFRSTGTRAPTPAATMGTPAMAASLLAGSIMATEVAAVSAERLTKLPEETTLLLNKRSS